MDLERGAQAQLAVDPYVAAALLTMPYTLDRPSPVPLPFSLVVKKGSKSYVLVCWSMPQPVSVTASWT
jgi:hypothetical protein